MRKPPGAQFEVSIDGTPHMYRDNRAIAEEAGETLKRKHPHSVVTVENLWVEILKEVAPKVRRVAFLHHPQTAAHIGFLRVIEATSNSVGVRVTAAGARDASEIEPVLKAFARESNGVVIVAPSPVTTLKRELNINLGSPARSASYLSVPILPKNLHTHGAGDRTG